MAGLNIGYWSGIEELKHDWQASKIFKPEMRKEHANNLINGWKDAILKAL